MFSCSTSFSRGVTDCTPELFRQMVDDEKVIRLCAEIEDAREMMMRGEMTREDFETFKSERKRRLPVFCFHATFPHGRRVNSDAVPSGLCIFDLDHVATPGQMVALGDSLASVLIAHVLQRTPITDAKTVNRLRSLGVVLAHVSPSGEGLRLVFVLPTDMDLAEGQRWMAQQLGCASYDESVKDYARCSFAVPREYILFWEEGLFKASPSPSAFPSPSEGEDVASPSPSEREDVRMFQEVRSESESNDECKSECDLTTPPSQGLGEAVEPSETFLGIPYPAIISEWWNRTGGMPQPGERNVKLHRLAVNLRAICDNRKELLMKVMPRLGLGDDELGSIVESACKEQPKGISKMIREIVGSLQRDDASLAIGQDDEEPYWDDDDDYLSVEASGKEPAGREPSPLFLQGSGGLEQVRAEMLCHGLRESLVGVPASMQMPVLCAVMPLAGAYADGVEVEYSDGKRMRLGLMSIIVGPQASGKSACKDVVDVWLRQMNEEDAVARRKEDKWRQTRRNRKSTEKAPADPEVLVRNVPITISCSALLKRMKNSSGHTLFSFGEELDTLRKTNGAGSWSSKYDVYRLSFDHGRWGQDYNSDQAESGVVDVAYNWSILGTYGALRKCFRHDNVENGLSSRLLMAEMPDNSFAPMPRYREISDGQQEAIDEDVTRLREAEGFVDTPRLRKRMAQWVEAKRLEALRTWDMVTDTYRKRAAVIGFRCGVIFRLLCGKESKTCLDFAEGMANYVLQEQSKLFGKALLEQDVQAEMEGQRTTANHSVFDDLPQVFTLRDVEALKSNDVSLSALRVIIHRWKADGWIEKVERGKWKKSIQN